MNNDSDSRFDRNDRFCNGARRIECEPGRIITRALDLTRDTSGAARWFRSNDSEPTFIYEVWGHPEAEDDREDRAECGDEPADDEAEEEARARRAELASLESRLLQRDEQLDQRSDMLEQRDRKLLERRTDAQLAELIGVRESDDMPHGDPHP